MAALKKPSDVTAVDPDADHAVAARLLAEGSRSRLAGDLAGAEACFEQAIERSYDFAEAHLALGDLQAASGRDEDALDCYQLAVHFSPQLSAAYLALAAALVRAQRFDEAEAACRTAISLESAASNAWFMLGNVLKARGDLAQAADAYRVAAQAMPLHLDALHQLAFVEARLGRYDDAHRNYRVLLAAAPASPNAHHNFGLLQLETGYPQEALASFRCALELQPGTIASLTCAGHALRDLGRIDDAIAAYDEALALQPGFGDASGNRSQALLMRGEYTAGWHSYDIRFAATGTGARTHGRPRWRGEPLAGKRIVVLPEQGVGDEIMFASCLPDLVAAAAHSVIECNSRLVNLFARSFPQARVRAIDAEVDADIAQADFEVSAGSLPRYLRAAPELFPRHVGYLQTDPARRKFWRERLAVDGAKWRVGIAWRGGTLRNRQYLRSLELADLLPVLQTADCAFFSLQHGDYAGDLHTLHSRHGIEVRERALDAGGDLDEFAAMTAAFDLVITVDNTVAHLCGALGMPVWILVPFSAEWRYGRVGAALPWYPSARLFRQPQPRAWTPVIAAVAEALPQYLVEAHVRPA